MKTTITRTEYHQLHGLLLLAKRHNDALKTIERAVADLLDEEEQGHGYFWHVSDFVTGTGDYDADALLRCAEVTVEVDDG